MSLYVMRKGGGASFEKYRVLFIYKKIEYLYHSIEDIFTLFYLDTSNKRLQMLPDCLFALIHFESCLFLSQKFRKVKVVFWWSCKDILIYQAFITFPILVLNLEKKRKRESFCQAPISSQDFDTRVLLTIGPPTSDAQHDAYLGFLYFFLVNDE